MCLLVFPSYRQVIQMGRWTSQLAQIISDGNKTKSVGPRSKTKLTSLILRTLRSSCLCFKSSASTGLLQVRRVRTMIGRRSFAVAGPACRTVFLLLYRDMRCHCVLPSDNSRLICSTSDVLTNRRNVYHHQTPDTKLHTYLLT